MGVEVIELAEHSLESARAKEVVAVSSMTLPRTGGATEPIRNHFILERRCSVLKRPGSAPLLADLEQRTNEAATQTRSCFRRRNRR